MNNQIRILVLYCFTLLAGWPVHAQNQLLFRSYAAEQSLSSNTVWCIAQDQKGYMWFGTKRGLNRFDGNRIKVYQSDSNNPYAIGSNFIHSLAVVSDTTLWVGTERGLFILNMETDRFTPVRDLRGVLIHDIITDARNRVWIATHGKGIYCYDQTTGKLKNYDTSAGGKPSRITPVRKLAHDEEGNIWMGTESQGIIVLDPENEVKKAYHTKNSGLPGNNILTLYRDLSGTMWAGTMDAGLARFDQQQQHFKTYRQGDDHGINNNIIRSVYQPYPDKLFVGTEKGLNVLDLMSDQFSAYTHQYNDPTSISDNAIYSICGDTEGGIWIGTYFGGVNYLYGLKNGIERYFPTGSPQHLSGSAVSSFLEDEPGKFWIGTEDGGLNYFDAQRKTFKHYPFLKEQQQLPYHNVHALTRDSKGAIWIGTFAGGLNVYNPATGHIRTYKHRPDDPSSISSNIVYTVYEDRDKNIWVGTVRGLNLYNPDSNSFMRLDIMGMNNHCLFAIHEDDHGIIWFATHNYGLIAKNKHTGEWQRFFADGKKGSLSSGKILAMLDDKRGNLWLGTEGGGLNRFSLKTQTAQVIDASLGLAAKVIYGIIQDDKGRLWVTTDKGLYCVEDEGQKVRHYPIWDGPRNLIFNYKAHIKASDGKLYVGGINGFGVFHPDSMSSAGVTPKVVLSNLQLFNQDVIPSAENSPLQKAVTYTDTVTLDHNQTVINIEYAGLSYVSPEKISYAYKLEGLDEQWNYVGNERRANYTNLAPGKYVFRVKADAGFDTWDAPETTLHITIRPPFYKTPLAYLFYLFTAVATFFWFRRHLIHKNRRANEIRLERMRIKDEKEFYNQKIEFFTMMAHEVRTPLSLIAGPVEKLLESPYWPEAERAQLETIDRNAARLSNLVNQLLDFRRIESDFYELHPANTDIVVLVKNIFSSFAAAARHHRGLDFTLTETIGSLIVKVDEEALTKILSNLIINALKFARNTVAIHLSMDDGPADRPVLSISVKDDGIGIPETELKNIFKKFFRISNGEHQYNNVGGSGIGLALAKSLTEKHGGYLDVTSKEGEYTVFTVCIPCYTDNILPETAAMEEEVVHAEAEERDLILIVEDHADLQHFIEKSLQAEGYRTLLAGTGREALSLLRSHDVNLIISDVMMPDIDGIELCRSVKDDITHSHIPVILLTAKTDSQAELAGIESGSDRYITKPFKVKHLIAAIKNLLDSRAKLMEKFATYPFTPAGQLTTHSRDRQFIESVVQLIEERISDPTLSVESLSAEMAMSRSGFHKKMKALCNYSPNEFIRLIRLRHAARLLASNDYSIAETGYISGFSSHSYFSKCFFNHFKLTPREFVEKHAGNKNIVFDETDL